jgi:hypothetical protein
MPPVAAIVVRGMRSSAVRKYQVYFTCALEISVPLRSDHFTLSCFLSFINFKGHFFGGAMTKSIRIFAASAWLLWPLSSAFGQAPANPAVSDPDKVAWQLFAVVNAPAAAADNNNATFETWANDDDTFQPTPTWPATPSLAKLKVPALIRFLPVSQRPRVLPGGGEEVRRNRDAFDFIVKNNLFKQSGLRAAFAGKPISFPESAIEVKANWVPVTEVADPSLYHVNKASDQKSYALVSMHIISKLVPNWTWATFEHRLNKGRCDYMGCRDSFGAQKPVVLPNKDGLNGPYDSCEKTAAVKDLFAKAKLPDVWTNYCLKGSQVDFVSATGVPTLLGNSVTEKGFVASSSCLTCHSRASVTASGSDAQGAGFVGNASPNGAPNPAWFWNNPGKPNQSLKAFQTDFVWAIPLLAIDQ